MTSNLIKALKLCLIRDPSLKNNAMVMQALSNPTEDLAYVVCYQNWDERFLRSVKGVQGVYRDLTSEEIKAIEAESTPDNQVWVEVYQMYEYNGETRPYMTEE